MLAFHFKHFNVNKLTFRICITMTCRALCCCMLPTNSLFSSIRRHRERNHPTESVHLSSWECERRVRANVRITLEQSFPPGASGRSQSSLLRTPHRISTLCSNANGCVCEHKDRKTGRTYLLPIPSPVSCPWMLVPDRIKNESNSNISCEKICAQQGPKSTTAFGCQTRREKQGRRHVFMSSFIFFPDGTSFVLDAAKRRGVGGLLFFYDGLWKLKILCIKLFSFLFVRWRIFFHSSLCQWNMEVEKVGSYNDAHCR